MYRDTVNETSHQEHLSGAKCDNCGKPAIRWFGSTSVRICDDLQCRARYQTEWDTALSDEDQE